MFLLLPIGHDQNVYGRQWITLFLIALNTLVFGATYYLSRDVDHRIDLADAEIAIARHRFPDARVSPRAVKTLPEPLRDEYADLVFDSGYTGAAGDRELRLATRHLVNALESSPIFRFGYRPASPSLLSAFTSLFVHGDIWHLLGNMVFLWLMGSVIECFWEGLPFAILYFVAGAAGTLLHHFTTTDGLAPLIGASGAIAGLMGAFLMGHPKTRIEFLWFFLLMRGRGSAPVWVLLPIWLAMELAFAFLEPDATTAHFAHVGGFVTGMLGAVIMRASGLLTYDAAVVLKK